MGIDPLTQRAVFLDRDGVINHNWFNPTTKEWESPIAPEQLRLCDGALAAMTALQRMGYLLFLVSNQPSAAKGKCGLDDLARVHQALETALADAGIKFQHFYYAYGHPQSVVPELRDVTGRKPDHHFIKLAIAEFELEPRQCWMIGDRDTDIEMGERAGLQTIQVDAPESDGKQGAAHPDFRAADLTEAVALIAAEDRA